jgi:3-oxoacyl-[acyl-carrier protein] reductase
MSTQDRALESAEAIDFERLSTPAGSRILIMGGNSGIGSRLAEVALSIGARVISLDTDAAIGERPLPKEITCLSIDALDATTIERAFADVAKIWQGVDGFVFLTGFSPGVRPLIETSLADWDAVLNVNLRSAFIATRLLVPMMRKGGAVVMVSSGLAVNVERGWGPYSASKAGLIAFAKVLAKEVAPDIRVNVVAPGVVDTPFLAGGTGRGEPAARSGRWFFESGLWDHIRPTILLERMAVPDDVVAPILFLLSTGARYLTGQTIHINGGRYLP